MILVKGLGVSFDMTDGHQVEVPGDFGWMHDDGTGGRLLPHCTVLVGPFKAQGKRPHPGAVSWAARKWFGDDYDVRQGDVRLPDLEAPWKELGVVERIYYWRTGDLDYYLKHNFKKRILFVFPSEVILSQRGSWLRLDLPKLCRIDERGFVSP